MLFPYTYVPHQMEKMQEFIDFIFYEVWCKAAIGLDFSPELFKQAPDLQEVMSYFGFASKAPERGKQFYRETKEIYVLFAVLTSPQIDQFKKWYQANNDIENVCANDPTTALVRYADIETTHPNIAKQLASFFKELYSQSLLGLAKLSEKIGEIDDHYKEFEKTNNAGKCPFCGISDVLGVNHTPREAYDHFLPKTLYPFNSINFHNLVPACHHCNSSYKTSKDPAYTPKGSTQAVKRRKIFYPYSVTPYAIEMKVELKHSDIDQLTATDVALQFGPPELSEEIETWKDIYCIQERYVAKFLSNDAMDWLEQARILNQNHSLGYDAIVSTIVEQSERDPFSNNNFLKRAFLEACQRRGIFKE